MLLDEVERFALLGEFFEAGTWWHEALRPIAAIQTHAQRAAAQKRMGEVSDEVVKAQRAAATRVFLSGLRRVPAARPKALRVGLPPVER